MSDDFLDTPQSCFQELVEINRAVAEYGHEWAASAGELKSKVTKESRLKREALRALKGQDMTVAERDAEAAFMVGRDNPELYDRIEFLEEQVEKYRTMFRAHDRRSSNAQSILAALKRESGMADYLYNDG